MSIDYGVEQLTSAVRSLAHGEGPLDERLQNVWTEWVQNLWSGVYLPDDLNDRFRTMWERYAAGSEDERSSDLRPLSPAELKTAVDEILDLAFDAVAARAEGCEAGRPPTASSE